MAERSSGLVAALVVVAVLAAGTFSFMFAMGVEKDEKEQLIAAIDAKIEDEVDGLQVRKTELDQEFQSKKRELETAEAELQKTLDTLEDFKRNWYEANLRRSDDERKKIQPVVRDYDSTVRHLFREFQEVLDTMKESREAFQADEGRLLEEVQIKADELRRTVRQFEERAKGLDDDFAVLEAKLREVRERLKIVQAEAIRGRTISDSGGTIIQVADPKTNYVVVNLGSADRLRKGLKFQVWTLRRGYGTGWVEVKGQDFVKDAIMPGDQLVVSHRLGAGRGDEAERHQIVSVGISREAEEKGMGLASHRAADTLKILGPGVTANFSVAGLDWKIERASKVKTPEELGVVVKGVIEITETRRHSSGAVILPERRRNPVCSQCGWEAYKPDMRHCPFCFLGDSDDEVQGLDTTEKGVLSRGQDPFKPIMVGDKLSNPYFAPNRQLIFVLGAEPVRVTRQHMKAFIEHNGGRVVGPEQLLVRPDEVSDIVREVMPYEIHYLIPGMGDDYMKLLTRARDLGIRIMREEELYEFFGAMD